MSPVGTEPEASFEEEEEEKIRDPEPEFLLLVWSKEIRLGLFPGEEKLVKKIRVLE